MAKQPYRPMTDINIMDDAPPIGSRADTRPALKLDPLPNTVEGMAAPPPEPRRQLNYRPTVSVAERLRLISFQQRRPVQELIDEAVLLWLSSQK